VLPIAPTAEALLVLDRWGEEHWTRPVVRLVDRLERAAPRLLCVGVHCELDDVTLCFTADGGPVASLASRVATTVSLACSRPGLLGTTITLYAANGQDLRDALPELLDTCGGDAEDAVRDDDLSCRRLQPAGSTPDRLATMQETDLATGGAEPVMSRW